jgi:hypothetical protein
MQISLANWIVIFPHSVFCLEIGLSIDIYYDRRAKEALGRFFITGRSVPELACRSAERRAGRRSDTIGHPNQKQSHISGGNGRLLCQ